MNRLPAAALALLMLCLPAPGRAENAPEPDPCAVDPNAPECQPRANGVIRPYEEYDRRLRAGEQVTPLGSDVFGDNVSLYNGATEFRVVDIDLPGNGPPVQLARRFKVEPRKVGVPLGGFGAWEIDVPYLVGTFTGQYKWDQGTGNNTQRCTSAWLPQLVHDFELREVWSGVQMHLPGQGDREVLHLDPNAGHPLPATGDTYRWITRDDFRFRCQASTGNGYFGESFVAIDREGTTYTFDIGLERSHGQMRRGAYQFARTRVYLMASEVTDRFGHWVRYHYSGVGPSAQLTGISASDGRSITLTYESPAGYARIKTASAHGRTWTYGYWGSEFVAGSQHPLGTVTLPDQSTWTYAYLGSLVPAYSNGAEDPYVAGCPRTLPAGTTFTFYATHPAGASGQFRFTHTHHGRSGVPSTACNPTWAGGYRLDIAYYSDNYALTQKTLYGVGLPTMTWTYAYPFGAYNLAPDTPPCQNAATCPESKTVKVTHPDGSVTEYAFGVRYAWNEGRLLKQRSKVDR